MAKINSNMVKKRVGEFDPARDQKTGGLINEPVVSYNPNLQTQKYPQSTAPKPEVKTNTVTGAPYYPEQITFNKNGTVTVSKGGKVTTQSKADYNATLPSSRMGGNAANINAIKNVQANRPLTAQEQAAQTAQGLGLTQEQIMQAEAQATDAPIDWGQAITAGTVKNAPSLITNIGGGAAAGALAAAPISAGLASTGVGAVPAGVIIGGAALLGAIKGIWGGVQQNIANQQKGEIGAAQDVLAAARTDMRLLVTLAAKDPANAERYVEAYNTRLAQVYQARAKIKLETQGNLNKFTEDGTDILSNFDLFLQTGGQADLYKIKLTMALNTGVAPEFSEEDLLSIQ